MTLAVMLSGPLAKAPETRTTKAGNPFAFTTVRVPSQDGDTYASVTVFDNSLVDTLSSLKPGDPVTVVGSGKLSIYTPAKGGDPRPNLSVTASRLITLVDQQAPLRQQSYQPRQQANADRRPRVAAPAGFDDDRIPF